MVLFQNAIKVLSKMKTKYKTNIITVFEECAFLVDFFTEPKT
jgi:hypothetical protein